MSEEIRKMSIHKVYDYAEQLQQENKQLKEKYLGAVADYETTKSENQQLKEQLKDENNYHNEAVKWYKEAFDIEQERIKYKSVLDEIREYCMKGYPYVENASHDILKILDKVKE